MIGFNSGFGGAKTDEPRFSWAGRAVQHASQGEMNEFKTHKLNATYRGAGTYKDKMSNYTSVASAVQLAT